MRLLSLLAWFCLCSSTLCCEKDRPTQEGPHPDLQVRAVIFAPHPDDETIAFGGLIYQQVHAGQTVKVVVVTDGDAYFGSSDFRVGEIIG